MRVHSSASETQDLPWLASLVFKFDACLRQSQAVFEFSQKPNCILRARVAVADAEAIMAGLPVAVGDRFLDLHLWNERIPHLAGSSLAWARAMHEDFRASLVELAAFLERSSELDDIALLRANVTLATAPQTEQIARIMRRYGFEPAGKPASSAAFDGLRRFGENILISLMVLARNGAALRADTLTRRRRLFFMRREILAARYGAGGDGGLRDDE